MCKNKQNKLLFYVGGADVIRPIHVGTWHIVQISWAELALSHPFLMAINNGELICLCNEF